MYQNKRYTIKDMDSVISDNTDLVQINLPVLPKLLVQRTLAEPEEHTKHLIQFA